MKKAFHPGNTLVEYSVVLGLVGLLALGSLQMLGSGTSRTLAGVSSQNDAFFRMTRLDFSSSAGGSANSPQGSSLAENSPGNAPISIDSATGQAIMEAFPNIQGVEATNATSVEGARVREANETYQLINQLQMLANTTTDEGTREWINTDLLHWMQALAGAEGHAAEIKGLSASVPEGTYSKAQALTDIEKLRSNLLYKRENNDYMLPGKTGLIVAKPSPQDLQTIQAILDKAIAGTQTFAPSSQIVPATADPETWDIAIYKAYGSMGREKIAQSLEAIQADGSIHQNATVAETAKGADMIEEMYSPPPPPAGAK